MQITCSLQIELHPSNTELYPLTFDIHLLTIEVYHLTIALHRWSLNFTVWLLKFTISPLNFTFWPLNFAFWPLNFTFCSLSFLFSVYNLWFNGSSVLVLHFSFAFQFTFQLCISVCLCILWKESSYDGIDKILAENTSMTPLMNRPEKLCRQNELIFCKTSHRLPMILTSIIIPEYVTGIRAAATTSYTI